MFVTNWNSTTKIQKISEITNFFRHYFLSRTEVKYFKNCVSSAKPDTKIELPEVNFLKYTLIYIQGESTHGIAKLESSLTSTESCKILSIHIEQNFTNVMQRWNVAYLIDKEDKPNIKLQYPIIEP